MKYDIDLLHHIGACLKFLCGIVHKMLLHVSRMVSYNYLPDVHPILQNGNKPSFQLLAGFPFSQDLCYLPCKLQMIA